MEQPSVGLAYTPSTHVFSPCPEPSSTQGADMLTRPPPLQLVYDNFSQGLRPAQAQQQPVPVIVVVEPELSPSPIKPRFAKLGKFAAKVYQANWRNFVIAIAAINALRFILSAWSFFAEADVDYRTYHLSKIAQISIALGALYLLTAFIQVFGVLSAFTQRLAMIRAYVYLAFLSALLISTAGFITGVQYFVLADDIISECVSLAVSGSWVSKAIFRGKLRHGQNPSPKVAQQQCHLAWSSGSLSQLLGIILFSIIPAILFFFIAYTYYRQTTDPAHSACLCSSGGTTRGGGGGDREGGGAYMRLEVIPNDGVGNGNGNGNANLGNGITNVRARTPRGTYLQIHHKPQHQHQPKPQPKPQHQPQPRRNPVQDRAAAMLEQTSLMRNVDHDGEESASAYGVSPGPPSYGHGHGYGYGAPLRLGGHHGYGQVWFGGSGASGRPAAGQGR